MFKGLRSIAYSFPPAICLLCRRAYQRGHAVCQPCLNQFPKLQNPCPQCGMPNTHGLCGQCIKQKPQTDGLWVAYPFIEPIRTLIHQFKYQKGLYLSKLLSELICHSHPPRPDCLIPIPMHPKRLHQRGFNQACLLSQQLSKRLKLPCDFVHCQKIKDTAPQAGLSLNTRKKNLDNCFSTQALQYDYVALVDDVYTSGATANALAKALKKSGVKRVDVWCVARTV